MKITCPRRVIVPLVGVTITLGLASAQPDGGPRPTCSDSTILVRFADRATARAEMDAPSPLLRALGGHVEWVSSTESGITVVRVSPGMAELGVVLLGTDPRVRFAHLDVQGRPLAVPNDDFYPTQWAAPLVHLPEAWDVRTKATVVIAIVDNGVDYTHPDLFKNMWTNPGEIAGNCVDDDHNGIVDDYFGADFTSTNDPLHNNPCPSIVQSPSGDPMGQEFHGTGVASIAGAVGNNENPNQPQNPSFLCGAAWSCKMMAIRWYGQTALMSAVIKSMDYAHENGAKIMNCSWYFPAGNDEALYMSMKYLPDTLFVVAAGNFDCDQDATLGPDMCVPRTVPQIYSLDNILCVGASDPNDCRFRAGSYPNSNWGQYSVDLFAPGGPGIPELWLNGQIGTGEGTSLAAPLVSGVAALVWSEHPSYSVQQVKDAIVNSVDVRAGLNGLCVSGGRLNAARALGVTMSQPGPNTCP